MRSDLGIFIFIVGLIAFNWPLLKIFDFSLPVYLFSIWLLFITVISVYSFKKKEDKRGR